MQMHQWKRRHWIVGCILVFVAVVLDVHRASRNEGGLHSVESWLVRLHFYRAWALLSFWPFAKVLDLLFFIAVKLYRWQSLNTKRPQTHGLLGAYVVGSSGFVILDAVQCGLEVCHTKAVRRLTSFNFRDLVSFPLRPFALRIIGMQLGAGYLQWLF